MSIALTQRVIQYFCPFLHISLTRDSVLLMERLPCQKTVTWWLAVDRCVFLGVTSCHDPLSGGGPWMVMMKQRTFYSFPGFLRYSWYNIRFTSGLQHNDLLFVHNVKCYHLSPHEEHVFLFPMQIICLVRTSGYTHCQQSLGMSPLFPVVSLLFSNKWNSFSCHFGKSSIHSKTSPPWALYRFLGIFKTISIKYCIYHLKKDHLYIPLNERSLDPLYKCLKVIAFIVLDSLDVLGL